MIHECLTILCSGSASENGNGFVGAPCPPPDLLLSSQGTVKILAQASEYALPIVMLVALGPAYDASQKIQKAAQQK